MEITCISSGCIKERSPTIPPWTWASAIPKPPLMIQTPMKGPSPPFPDVAKSNYKILTMENHKIFTQEYQTKFHTNFVHLELKNIKWKKESGFTIKTMREQMKNRTYPKRFRLLVLIFASLYASIEIVPRANGWYTRVRTLEGWYFCTGFER